MINTIYVIIGIILLALGRRLYWFIVGAAGFVAGIYLSAIYLPTQSDTTRFTIALVAGLIGILVAAFLQRIALFIVGFLAGGYAMYLLFNLLGHPPAPVWLFYLVGGIIGAIFVAVLFDWALIVLSSIGGAGLIVNAFHINGWIGGVAFFVLIIIGWVTQNRIMRYT